MKTVFTLLSSLLFLATATTQDIKWMLKSDSLRQSGNALIGSMTTTTEKGVVFSTSISGQANSWGNSYSFSQPSNGMVISKLDAQQKPVWTKTVMWGGKNSTISQLEHDKYDNIYAVTLFQDTLWLSATKYYFAGASQDFLITKFDKNGNWIWSSLGHRILEGLPKHFTVSPEGNCYFQAFIDPLNNMTVASTAIQVPSGRRYEAFTISLDKSGNLLWASCILSDYANAPSPLEGITCLKNGNLLVASVLKANRNYIVIDNDTVFNDWVKNDSAIHNYVTNVLCEYDFKTGKAVKHKIATHNFSIEKIISDSEDNIFLMGKGQNLSFNINAFAYNTAGEMVCKMDNVFNPIWATGISARHPMTGISNKLTIDPYGNVCLSLSSGLTSEIVVGLDKNNPVKHIGDTTKLNGHLIYLDNITGKTKWLLTIGSAKSHSSFPQAIFIDSGNAYITGVTSQNQGKYQINSTNYTTTDSNLSFIALIKNNQLLSFSKLLTATATSQSQINLSWYDSTTGEDKFMIERSPDGINNWVLLDSVPANSTSYSDKGLTANTTYYYRTHTKVSFFSTPPGNVASATTLINGIVALPLQPNIEIWPNPSSDLVNIKSTEPLSELSLFDLNGKLITTNQLNGENNTVISLSTMPAGIYVLRVRDKRGGYSAMRLIRTLE